MTVAVSFYQHVITGTTQDVRALHRAVYLDLLTTGERRDFVYLPMQAACSDVIPVLVRSAKPRPGWRREQVANDDVYDFLLTCYILVSVPGTRRKYVPKQPERRMAWFEQQARFGGITLREAYETGHRRYLQLAIRPGVSECIFATTFTGRLQVTDAVRFTEKLTTGFGKSMTYGLGMMLLNPVAFH